MKGLLIKDLKYILSQKNFFIIAIAMAGVFTWTTDDVTFGATYIILLLSMLTLTTISYDNWNGGMLFILSLPVDRKMYVREKYVFALANLVFSALVSIAVCFGMATVKGVTVEFTDLLASITGITAAMSLMLGITIPLEIKFGVEKGRVAMIVAAVSIALVGYGGYKLLTEVFHIDVNAVITDIITHLPEPGAGLEFLVVGMLLAVVVLILSVSYVISYRIMKKKEF